MTISYDYDTHMVRVLRELNNNTTAAALYLHLLQRYGAAKDFTCKKAWMDRALGCSRPTTNKALALMIDQCAIVEVSAGRYNLSGLSEVSHAHSRLVAVAGHALADPFTEPRMVKSRQVIESWISNGYNLERDIVPIVIAETHNANYNDEHIFSWAFFTPIIQGDSDACMSEPNRKHTLDDTDRAFKHFWYSYPDDARQGSSVNKAFTEWLRLSHREREQACECLSSYESARRIYVTPDRYLSEIYESFLCYTNKEYGLHSDGSNPDL